jgi:F-type H+-transporting ATPase subunit a
MSSPKITLVAEPIFHIGPITITNSTVLGTIGVGLLFWLLFYTKNRINSRRYTRLSIAMFWGFETLLTTTEEILGDKKLARRLAPLGITMFFVIIINNWIEILPFIGTVTINGTPLFRGLAADLNFTAALAIITMVTAQIWAIKKRGFFGNLNRYIANPFTHPTHAFEGSLEIIAEFSRLIALSMRLFGNIFGGEVLLLVISYISSWAAPLSLPIFMFLELFVGAIQAYVFFMLTVVFISLGTSSVGVENDGEIQADSQQLIPNT